jgi:tight adherence protein B
METMMSLELMVATAVFFAVLGLAIAVLNLGARKSTRLQARLSRHAVRVASVTPQRIARVNVLGKSSGRGSPALARRLGKLSFVQKSRVTLIHANVKFGVGHYYLIRLLLAILAFGILQIVSGSLLFSLGAALVAFMIPRIVVRQKASRRAAAFENLLAETLDLFVGSLRAGQGLLQAIESSSYEQPEPMRSELRRIVGQVTMGMSITDAMESMTTRFDSRDVDLLAAAIAINRETGGNLTEVLDRLAKTVRQRREIRAEAKSLTAAPRATGYMLAVLPIGIAAYCVAASPVYRDYLLNHPIGRILAIAAFIWSMIGFFVSQKLAKAEY